ncbi:MAG: CFI-box-CTERM domain-containing protein [Planctomycetota bacterium]
MYKCDICSHLMPSKESGTHFDQNRVLTSPGYWEHLFGKPDFDGGMLGGFLGMLCRDPTGFTVCSGCKNMLLNDTALTSRYGLSQYLKSIPSGMVDSHAAGMVAGTVWKERSGSWPETIAFGDSADPRGTMIKVSEEKKTSGCFVATAAYGGTEAWQVRALRAYRDQRLSKTRLGRMMIRAYYSLGPALARLIRAHPLLCKLMRGILEPIARRCRHLTGRG